MTDEYADRKKNITMPRLLEAILMGFFNKYGRTNYPDTDMWSVYYINENNMTGIWDVGVMMERSNPKMERRYQFIVDVNLHEVKFVQPLFDNNTGYR